MMLDVCRKAEVIPWRSPALTFVMVAGFVFSENEHTALEQFEGGPCAVIAPVQVRSTSAASLIRPMNDS